MQLTAEHVVVEEGLDQHYEVLKELGDCHASLGNHDRARQCYEEAAVLAPEKAGPAIGLGVVELQSDNPDAADRAFRRAVDIEPDCAEAYGGLAMVCQRRGRYQEAFDLYMTCLDKDADNLVALLGLFQTSCQMGSFGRVIGYLQTYLRRHPGDTSVLFCLATLQARDGRFDEATQALEMILTLEPENGEAAGLLDEVRRRERAGEAVRS
ncbi:MAG: tetratricopeptide repeat protein [Phycisphaerae bacterium]